MGKLLAQPYMSERTDRLPIGRDVATTPRAEHDPRGHDGQNGIYHHEQRAFHRQKHEVHDKRDHERQRHGRFDVLLVAVAETRPPQNAEQGKPRAAAQTTRHSERGVPRDIKVAHPDENGPDACAAGAEHTDHALRRISAPLLAQQRVHDDDENRSNSLADPGIHPRTLDAAQPNDHGNKPAREQRAIYPSEIAPQPDASSELKRQRLK